MAQMVRLLTCLCIGENALMSRCLRNRSILNLSQVSLALGGLIATVSAIATIYRAIDQPQSDREILWTVGGLSTIITVVSCCGSLYITDFKRVLEEGRLRKAVGEAGKDIAEEATSVRREVRAFAVAQLSVTSSVAALAEHVELREKKWGEFEKGFHSAKKVHEAELAREQTLAKVVGELKEETQRLETTAASLASMHQEIETLKTDTAKRMDDIEAQIAIEEEKVVREAQLGAVSVAKLIHYDAIERKMAWYADADPVAYRKLLNIIPELRFVSG